MCRNWILNLLLILGMLLVAGCSRADFAPLKFSAAPWRNGEVSEYRMSNSAGEPIGTASMGVASGADASGDPIWSFRRELLSEGDQQLSVVEMDAATLRPTQAVWTRSRAEGVETVKTTYNGAQVDLELTNLQAVLTNERISIPSDARDDHTIAMLVRALPLASGYATHINTFLPVMGVTERVEVVVSGAERIEVPAGAFEAWKVDLDTETAASMAWIGKEAAHPLLKLEDDRSGVIFELVSFQPGE